MYSTLRLASSDFALEQNGQFSVVYMVTGFIASQNIARRAAFHGRRTRCPAPLRTDAIVLRSIRYGEADRILHLYTPDHGRLSAIAKGARRARSRFGARLEPCFQIRAVLHVGRSELLTVTAVDTVATHAGPARPCRHARCRGARL